MTCARAAGTRPPNSTRCAGQWPHGRADTHRLQRGWPVTRTLGSEESERSWTPSAANRCRRELIKGLEPPPSSSSRPTAARRRHAGTQGSQGSTAWSGGRDRPAQRIALGPPAGERQGQVIAAGPADQRCVKASSTLRYQSTSNSATGTSGAELLGTSGWARRLCSQHARGSTHLGPRGPNCS
jgi:hypothetical protein